MTKRQRTSERSIRADYRWLSVYIYSMAENLSGGRIVSALEGEYALAAVGRLGAIHVPYSTGDLRGDSGSPTAALHGRREIHLY